MIKAIIIDDEFFAREIIRNIIKNKCSDVSIIAEAENVESGITAIKKNKPDLVFLDVQMPDGTGFDILEKLKPVNFKIIFITAYDKYAINAFKHSAVDYILKPVKIDELVNAIDKIKKDNESRSDKHYKYDLLLDNIKTEVPNKIIIPTNDGFEFIVIDNIIRIEADRSYSVIYLIGNEIITLSKSLSEIEELLNNKLFFRIHKSHLINLKYIKKYLRKEGAIIMTDESIVKISQKKKNEFLHLLK